MEKIKVTRETITNVIFMLGDTKTGTMYSEGSQIIKDKKPQNLNINPEVVYFYFGENYVLTDEKGKTYTSNNHQYDNISPYIYCGRAVSTAQALKMFEPDTWQYKTISACQKDGIKRVVITATGFVEGINQDGLTLEEYVANYENKKQKVLSSI